MLLMLPFLEDVSASSTLCRRKSVHRSASDSLWWLLPAAAEEADDASEKKNSVLRDGVLGVRWKGELGRRRLLLAVPGRASPACSRCSSVHASKPAMICRIWNFLGSDRSRARNWRKWFVTICLFLFAGRCQYTSR